MEKNHAVTLCTQTVVGLAFSYLVNYGLATADMPFECCKADDANVDV
jgi:hypothetical protein